MNEKTAVVTGAGSGIGRAAARELFSRGYRVFDLSRRDGGNPFAEHIGTDVTEPAQVEAAAAEVLGRTGRIDVLVCCAGAGISGACEFTPREEALRQLDVNLLGVHNACRAVLPAMRKRKAGRIVTVSSVAAEMPIPFQAFYSASKAALNSYTMALDNEVRPFGIRVCAVMPGDTRTGFTAARRKIAGGDDVYGGRIARSVAVMEKDESRGDAPEKAAVLIADAAEGKTGPLAVCGAKYRFFCFLKRFLPARLLNYILFLLYGGGKGK